MKVAFSKSILYYDCELLFEAVDENGRGYIAVHDSCQTDCKYIVAPATRANLTAFKAGRIGLRDLLLAAPDGEWYITEPGGDAEAIPLIRQPTPITEQADLLETDYYVMTADTAQTQPEGAEKHLHLADTAPHDTKSSKP